MSKKNQSEERRESTIKVGILHSLTGTMAISEVSLKDAELMAIAEINAAGGVLGKPIEAIVEDGSSSAQQFAVKAQKLVQKDKVVTLFGGWTSAIRKAVLPVLEENNAQLWYPVEYEGLESSPYIFYTGICPNQQIEPTVNWLREKKGKKFYLVGSNYVFPRTLNKIIKAHVKQQGGTIVGEEYEDLGTTDFRKIIKRIQETQPDVVFNTLNGDSNITFYQQYQDAGITADEIPILAVSVAEDEVRRIGSAATGHYATWSYFQSIDTPENQAFVRNFKALYGEDRVTSDPIESAYLQVYLWKQAVEKAGMFEVDRVREAAYGQTFAAPGGLVRIENNNHLWKTCRIGKILPNGQFQIVWTSEQPIKPLPWLGLEALNGSVSMVAIDMLGEVSQAIQYSCQMEEKSREVEAAMAEVRKTNKRLQQTQKELVESETRFRELRSRVELLKRRVSSQIHTSLNIDTILKTAVHEIRSLLEIDRCQFLWLRTDMDLPIYQLSYEACDSKLSNVSSPNPIQEVASLGQAIRQMNMLQIDDVQSDWQLDAQSQKMLSDRAVQSLIAVAVHTNSAQRGVLVCLHSESCHPWSENEIELLQDVAMQLAIAIDKAKLYDRSCEAAAAATDRAEKLKQALYDLKQTQAQLIQTEKISGLGSLVADVAHEINNPVNFIYGNLSYATNYLQDLLQLVRLYEKYYTDPAAEIQNYAKAIDLEFLIQDLPQMLSSMKVGADRISELVRSLRNFSRVDTEKMQIVDLHEGIETNLLILQHRLKAKPNCPAISVIKQFSNLPLVECYQGQINQVFMNILSNAIDALEEISLNTQCSGVTTHPQQANPTITIRTEVLHPDRVTVRISDNGPGMTEEVQHQIFEAFFTTKPIGKGTGLGMSISYHIVVEKHGGSIQCVSAPGQGTEFSIQLPVRQPVISPSNAPNSLINKIG